MSFLFVGFFPFPRRAFPAARILASFARPFARAAFCKVDNLRAIFTSS